MVKKLLLVLLLSCILLTPTSRAYADVGVKSSQFEETEKDSVLGFLASSPNEQTNGNIATGTCGTNISWSIDSEGKLEISGTGAMKNYEDDDPPWMTFSGNISEIIIGNGVTKIGDFAFGCCRNAKKVVIADSVSYIGEGAFGISINELTMPASASICRENDMAFRGSAQKVHLTKGTGIIQSFSTTPYKTCRYYGYAPWSSSRELIIDDGIVTVGDAAFYKCKALVSIPSGISRFGANSFYSCENLTGSLDISSAESIGENCFYGCYGLTTVCLPENISSVGNNAFYLVNNVQYSGSLDLGDCGAKAVNGFVKDGLVFNNDSMTELLGWNEEVRSFEVPTSVTRIGENAFYKCSWITSVLLPDSLLSLGKNAFSDCYNIFELNVPSSVEEVGTNCVYMIPCVNYSGSLTNLEFIGQPRSVNGLIEGDVVYADESKAKIMALRASADTFTVFESVSVFDHDAFYGCSAVKNIYVDSLEHWCTIDKWPMPFSGVDNFYVGGTRISEIVIPENVTSIKEYCFNSLKCLTSLQMHDGVVSVGEGAFSGCTGLVNLTIPASVSMKTGSFKDCSNIEDITISKGTGQMQDYTVKTVLYSATPWYISRNALRTITMDDGISYIGSGAFMNNTFFTELALPRGLESIGANAFYSCSNLTDITIWGGVESIGDTAIDSIVTIHGYAGSEAEKYATANGNSFEIIREPAFATNSLVLSGEIGVNFYMDLPEIEGIDYEDSFMEFTLCGKTVREDFDATRMNPKGTYYKFTCYANAIQMADEITAVFHYVENGEEKTLEQKYSVQEYIRSYEEDGSWSEELIALVHALADYGHYAQIFLSEYKGWQLGTDHAVMDTYYTSSYADVEQFKEALGDQGIERETNADVTAVSFSLSLDSSTTINLYFSLTDGYDGGFSVTVDGNQVAAKRQADGRYRVTIPSISAHRLGRRFAVQTTTDAGVVDVAVSALSYVKACLDAPLNANETAVISALYRYYETAIAYIG